MALALGAGSAWCRDWAPAHEQSVGAQALEQVLKEYKPWDNSLEQERLERIVSDLKPFTQRPDVSYRVVLLDNDETNAFSLPGSILCVYRGLVEKAQSDHELAGVLAHEMAHNCTFDALNESQRAKEVSLPVMAAVLAAMLTGRDSETVARTFQMGLYVGYGVLSHYSIRVERRADRNAADYMIRSGKYNPVGLLTFMERLATQESRQPRPALGVFQTHPYSSERAVALGDQMEAAGLVMNRRAVSKWDPPQLAVGEGEHAEQRTVSLWGVPLFAFTFAPPGQDPAARGEAILSSLTTLLAAGVDSWEFHARPQGVAMAVEARGQILLTIYPEETTSEQTVTELSNLVLSQLDTALFSERLNRLY